MPNTRIRGKIPHGEWPKIALRFQKGETLTAIARSYSCTAPAIRYIVARMSAGGAKADRNKLENGTLLAPPVRNRRATRIGGKEREDPPYVGGGSPHSPRDVWGRISSDIALFLAAMDSLFSDDSLSNFEELLAATDRLLWATARARLELERILDNRKKTSIRRISG